MVDCGDQAPKDVGCIAPSHAREYVFDTLQVLAHNEMLTAAEVCIRQEVGFVKERHPTRSGNKFHAQGHPSLSAVLHCL